jgi:hypothetical protein
MIAIPQFLDEIPSFLSRMIQANPHEPISYRDALNSHESKLWKKAMDEEIESLLANKTWKRVTRPKLGVKVLHGKWVYKLKRKVDNTIARYKARWVVKGYE